MGNQPEVRLVVPADDGGLGTGSGSKLFVNGIEFENLQNIKYSSEIDADKMRVSKLEITFFGDIMTERAGQ